MLVRDFLLVVHILKVLSHRQQLACLLVQHENLHAVLEERKERIKIISFPVNCENLFFFYSMRFKMQLKCLEAILILEKKNKNC